MVSRQERGGFMDHVEVSRGQTSGNTMVRKEDERRMEGGGEREKGRERQRAHQELVILAELHTLFSQEPEALLSLRFF